METKVACHLSHVLASNIARRITYQRERAERFGVCQKAIWQALENMGLTYKKTLRHPKADESARQTFQQKKTTV